jgi:enterochelin esterase family protein
MNMKKNMKNMRTKMMGPFWRGLGLCLLAAGSVVVGQGAQSPTPPSPPVAGDPPAAARGRGTRPPLTAEDAAEIATLETFPAWTPGSDEGNYFIGPEYAPAPELSPRDGVPKGRIETFTLTAADSRFFADTGLRGATPTRQVTVYIPRQYVAGTAAPLIVSCDAYGARNGQLPTILDNMIADRRLPPIIAVMVANGGGDGPGSQRGLEYDTVWGKYAEFVEAEVLPRVERDYGVTITKDPDRRMTLGGSSGGSAAFSMAWFHPEWYRRVLIYSGTFVNQHPDADYPQGAWDYHDRLVPQTPAKPLRIWMHVSQNDNGATSAASGLHNWVIANIRMARALKAKGYHYQFIYAKGAGHTDGKVISQTYPQALAWVWQSVR